jgi:hypothetical protein
MFESYYEQLPTVQDEINRLRKSITSAQDNIRYLRSIGFDARIREVEVTINVMETKLSVLSDRSPDELL